VGEDNRGDVGVVEVSILLAAEETVTKTTASGDGNRGQLHAGVANIAQSVNAVNVGVLVLVDLDVVLVVNLDTSILNLELLDLGSAANGPEDTVNVHGALALVVLVVQLLHAIAQILELALRAVGVNVETLALVLVHNLVLNHGIEGTEELVMANEQVGLCAEVVEHASHLNGNVTGADDGDLLGLLLEVEEAITVDTELFTLNTDLAGTTANGNEDLLCAHLLLLTVLAHDLDDVLGDERGSSIEVLDLVVLEVLLVDSIQTLDVGVTLVLEGGPVEGSSLLNREAIGLGFVDGLLDGGGVPGNLLGHTSVWSMSEREDDVRDDATYPTLTQVPPSLEFSTAMVFMPYWPLALLAAARPPLPIPMTRKSHSLGVGAMMGCVVEKWRVTFESLEVAVGML